MTQIKFGEQFDQSHANFDISTARGASSKISVGGQHDESTRDVTIRDGGSLPAHAPGPNMAFSEPVTSTSKQSGQRLNTILAFSFGFILIAVILTLAVAIKEPTLFQARVFSTVLALAGGGFATVVTGMLNVRLKFGQRLAIGATGALAVFVIVYFFAPAMAGAK